MNTLEILQERGFTCHIDDLSADEPFLQAINGQPFATVPYTVHLNDIASFGFPGFNPAACRTTPPPKGKQHGRPSPGVHRGTPASFH